ncbi:DMT family transporter [Actinomycetes bacterium M1A6_2h]
MTATLSLKGAQTHPVLYAVVVAGYLAGFVGLALVLKRGMGLGAAYGIWGASGVALTAVFSALVFGEALTVVMLCGIALIIAGVVLVESGSHHDTVG